MVLKGGNEEKKGKKPRSSVLNYFSLPRRKKKTNHVLEISYPLSSGGYVVEQLPKSNSNLDLSDSKTPQLQPFEESPEGPSNASGIDSRTSKCSSVDDLEKDLDRNQLQRLCKVRQTFHSENNYGNRRAKGDIKPKLNSKQNEEINKDLGFKSSRFQNEKTVKGGENDCVTSKHQTHKRWAVIDEGESKLAQKIDQKFLEHLKPTDLAEQSAEFHSDVLNLTNEIRLFSETRSSDSDYDFPKSTARSEDAVDGPTQRKSNKTPDSSLESDYDFPKRAENVKSYAAKPVLEGDYDIPRPVPESDYDIPRPVPESDYDFPRPVPESDYDIPKPVPESDYDIPRPVLESDYVIPRPVPESDYDTPKPLPESDYDTPKPVHLPTLRSLKPSYESDYDTPRALLKLGYGSSTAVQESDYDTPRPVRSSNDSPSTDILDSDDSTPCSKSVQAYRHSDRRFHDIDSLEQQRVANALQPGVRMSVRTSDPNASNAPEKNILNISQDSGIGSLNTIPFGQPEMYSSEGSRRLNISTSMLNASQVSPTSDLRIQSRGRRSKFDPVKSDTIYEFAKSSQRTASARSFSLRKFPASVWTKPHVDLAHESERDETVNGSIKTPDETTFRNKPTIKIDSPDSNGPSISGTKENSESNYLDLVSDADGNCMARALFSNTAESPDELEFRKDDLLTVLEQNTAGLEGWWLCSLRGRQGICPGNRLRIIPGCYDTGSGVPTTLVRPHIPPAVHGAPVSSTTMPRSTGNKVVTPKRVGDTYTYDTPRRHVGSSPAPHLTHYPTLDYDVPRGPPVINHDGPRLSRSSSLRYEAPRHIPRGSYELHDVPTSPYDQQTSMHYDIPRPHGSTVQSALYDSPRPQMATGAPDQHSGVPIRSLIKGIRGPQPAMCSSATPVKLPDSDSGQYDVPKPLHEAAQLEVPTASDRSSGVSIMSCDSTSSSASSVPASESPYLSSIGGSSNRSSLEVQDVYDVPPEPRKVGSVQKPRLPPREYATRPQTDASGDKNTGRSEGVYDVPPQVSRDARTSDAIDSTHHRIASDLESVCDNAVTGSSLPLEYDSAIDMLSKLQQDVHVSLEKLANFNVVVSPVKKPVSDERFNESKVIIDRLKDALQEFIKFAKGAAVNGYKAGYERLATTLQQQVERLVSTYDIIKNTWSCAQHNREEALDVVLQLTSITKPLADDVRHLANVIQVNAPQIFKRTPSGEQMKQKIDMKGHVHETPTRDVPTENVYANESAILEDYDYVKLESKETAEREHQQIKESLPANLRKSYDNLVKQSHSVVDNDHQRALSTSSTSSTLTSKNLNSGVAAGKTCRLDANDRQVLAFYSNQAEQHIQHLNNAIDAFFRTIEENQPPKVFIAHSKFVILSAHKLVFIGDTVHRNVVNSEVRSCVLNCSNALCDAMKNTVAAAKTAAIQFPSVAAVQAMVDSFTTISNLACNLRNAICRN